MKKIDIKKIGIIGGTHGLGKRFEVFFSGKYLDEKEVLISGRNTKITNKDIVETCDLVIFSVPIGVTEKVIMENIPYSRDEQIWVDITSIKQSPVKAMMESKAEVCGLHPLFGPLPEIKGNMIYYCPEKISHENLETLKMLLAEFKLIETTPKEHDDLMGIVQCVSHFSDLVMGETLRKSGLDFQKIIEASTPSYQLKLEVMGRMFAQNAELYASIATDNPSSNKYTNLFLEVTQDFQKYIKNNEPQKIVKEFENISDYLGDEFCEKSWKDSQQFLNRLKDKKVTSKKLWTPKFTNSDKVDVAVFGENASHTDEASQDFFDIIKPSLNKLNKGADSLVSPSQKFKAFHEDLDVGYSRNIFEVFEAVDNGNAPFGVLPYENSTEGSIFQTLDNLFLYPNISIIAGTERKISQCLLGLPGAKSENITRIYSHPQALAQSQKFLRKNYPNAKLYHYGSTALAGWKILRENNPEFVAIGSPALAKTLCLDILEKDMQTVENKTKFILISKQKPSKNKKNTSFVFWFGDDHSGNLAQVLTHLSEKNINLIKLDSRRTSKKYGKYLFFIDAEVKLKDFEKEIPVLKKLTGGIRILGTF